MGCIPDTEGPSLPPLPHEARTAKETISENRRKSARIYVIWFYLFDVALLIPAKVPGRCNITQVSESPAYSPKRGERPRAG